MSIIRRGDTPTPNRSLGNYKNIILGFWQCLDDDRFSFVLWLLYTLC